MRFEEGIPEAPAHLEEILRSFTSRNILPELTEEEYDEIMSEKPQALRERFEAPSLRDSRELSNELREAIDRYLQKSGQEF